MNNKIRTSAIYVKLVLLKANMVDWYWPKSILIEYDKMVKTDQTDFSTF